MKKVDPESVAHEHSFWPSLIFQGLILAATTYFLISTLKDISRQFTAVKLILVIVFLWLGVMLVAGIWSLFQEKKEKNAPKTR
jgi:uncharacterized membrane protein HdeD (DUF308 family)